MEYSAARVDGAGEWRTLLRVIIPMAKPGIAATSMFTFFYILVLFFFAQKAFVQGITLTGVKG